MKWLLIVLMTLLWLPARAVPTEEQTAELKALLKQGSHLEFQMQEARRMVRCSSGQEKAEYLAEGSRLRRKYIKARQEAIVLADLYYGLQGPNAKGEPTFDPEASGEGTCRSDGTVVLGEDAFQSIGWLVSTKLHEFTHTDQAAQGHWGDDSKQHDMNEIQAYDAELSHSVEYGLTETQSDDLKSRRKKYWEALSEDNRSKVDSGNYVAEAVHLKDAVETGQVEVKFRGEGVAAGKIFQIELKRLTSQPITVEIPLGTLILPGRTGVQRMMVASDLKIPLPRQSAQVDVAGHCLDPSLKPPPTPEQTAAGEPVCQWTLENPCEDPATYGPPARVIRAGQELAAAGRLHNDLPPGKQLETVVQRALWRQVDGQGYGKDKLRQDIEKQVQSTGGRQTPEQIQQLTDNVWADVDLTLKTAR